MRKPELKALKAGDKVGIMPIIHHGNRLHWKIVTIASITKRIIRVDNGDTYSAATGYSLGERATCLVSHDNALRQNRHVKAERSTEALNQIRHHMVALSAADRETLRGEL